MNDHEALFDMSNRQTKGKVMARIGQMNGPWVIGAKPYKPTRSNRANAYYWVAVVPAMREFMKSHGHHFSGEEVHEFLLQKHASKTVVDPVSGELLGTIGERSSKMDTARFSQYVNDCIEWMSEKFNIEVPPPSVFNGEPAETTKRKAS